MKAHLVTILILFLYSSNVIWYLFAGKPWNSGYWFFAAGITICATWGTGK